MASSSTHVIRLHGPWTARLQTAGRLLTRRVHLPREWPELTQESLSADVSLLRRFHRPTGLSSETRVALVMPPEWPVRDVRLNGESLGTGLLVRNVRAIDLSKVVRQREAHDLEIDFEAGDGLAGQPYGVAFEIDDGA